MKLKQDPRDTILRALRGGRKRPSKYRNKRVTFSDGRTYDSISEARYALQLESDKRAGFILGFMEQVSIPVAPGTRYRPDFVVFRHADATKPEGGLVVRWIDVKGKETPTFKVKRKVVESRYPWVRIELVKPDWIARNCPQLPRDAQVG